jgi:heptosyltransferase-1
MARILFIKTSSLGDVIHHMPAVVDARRAAADADFTWLVEEAYAPLVRLHPAVKEVIPVAWRRWRKSLYALPTLSEICGSLRRVRSRSFDEVIDTQGLLRSALMARIARGRRHGYDAASIREPLASVFYDIRYQVARELHAVDRNRTLTGLALDYAPQGKPDFGLDRAHLRVSDSRYAVLLHSTARPEKLWPEANWVALGKMLAPGIEFRLPWGSEAEHARSLRIAGALTGARATERMPLDGVAKLIAGAQFVVGVDTGLLHLAAALGVPLVAIFTGSQPTLTGPVGSGPIAVLGANGIVPSIESVAGAVAHVAR